MLATLIEILCFFIVEELSSCIYSVFKIGLYFCTSQLVSDILEGITVNYRCDQTSISNLESNSVKHFVGRYVQYWLNINSIVITGVVFVVSRVQ